MVPAPSSAGPRFRRYDIDDKRQALQAKRRVQHLRSGVSNGPTIAYVQGWHVITEANRIFGYVCWDRKTLSPRCVGREIQRGQTVWFYTAKVRITVTAGGPTIVRDGMGTGTGRAAAPEAAHEIAMKAAGTDATNRALATFGSPFGLTLYDKEKLQVTRSRRRASETSSQRSSRATSAATPQAFALVQCTTTAPVCASRRRSRLPKRSSRWCRHCRRSRRSMPSTAEVCRKHGVSGATFYIYGRLPVQAI